VYICRVGLYIYHLVYISKYFHFFPLLEKEFCGLLLAMFWEEKKMKKRGDLWQRQGHSSSYLFLNFFFIISKGYSSKSFINFSMLQGNHALLGLKSLGNASYEQLTHKHPYHTKWTNLTWNHGTTTRESCAKTHRQQIPK
jgi:hypothetical protein